MNSIAGSLSQYVPVAPSVVEAQLRQVPQARPRRGVGLAARAEQVLFSASILGAAVLAGSFLWQILQ